MSAMRLVVAITVLSLAGLFVPEELGPQFAPVSADAAAHAGSAKGHAERLSSLSPPFDECPAIGDDSGCGTVLVVNKDGSVTVSSDPSQGPYDGNDDTLIGIINNSSEIVSELTVQGPPGLFAFDRDGICSPGISPHPSGCPFGPTGYEGPGVRLFADASSQGSGAVYISGGLGVDRSTYFALEDALTSASLKASIGTSRYVALGDSYASGEGVPPFDSTNSCHRSHDAYAPLLVRHHAGGPIPSTVSFWACSGALTADFYNASHSSGEPPQLSHLDGATTLLTFSVGGNDIGFAHIGATCLKVNATIFEQENPDYKPDCRNLLDPSVMSAIDKLPLAPLYRKIVALSPAADVYVMGYPDILPRNPSGDCQAQAYREDGRKATASWPNTDATDGIIGIETRIAKDDVAWMNKVVDRLNGKIATEAANAGFHFVDMSNAFAGHDVCSNNTDQSNRPWAHGLVLLSNANRQSSFSFHPNSYGQATMMNYLYDAIRGGSHVTVHQGKTDLLSFLVAAGRAMLHLLIQWPGSKIVTTIISPSGQVYRGYGRGYRHFVTGRTENFVIPNPREGRWVVKVRGVRVAPGGEQVRVNASTVPAASLAPVAVLRVSATAGVAPLSVKLSGRASRGSFGRISKYSWNFGDGSRIRHGDSTSHLYRRPGVFKVRLTVKDAMGRADSATQRITVTATDQPPTPKLVIYQDPQDPGHIYFDSSNSVDPDGRIVKTRVRFGDGSRSFRPQGAHQYKRLGTYKIQLKVTDNAGRSAVTNRTVRVFRPPSAADRLNGVSCMSASECMAVGIRCNPTTSCQAAPFSATTLVERWVGKRWMRMLSPNKARAESTELNAIDCSSSRDCMAVGESRGASEAYAPLAERWNGTRWSILRVPFPATSQGYLNGVSCSGPTSCLAVGDRVTLLGSLATLAAWWNGSRWSVVPSANPSNVRSLLRAVSCIAPSRCIAVGSYAADAPTKIRTLTERWNGNSLSLLPSPSSTEVNELRGVSCTKPWTCVAVGDRRYTSGRYRGLVLRWTAHNGWTALSIPPVSHDSLLDGISCVRATQCVASGDYTARFGRAPSLMGRWDGSHWSLSFGVRFRTPSYLKGVSCARATACQAVGYSLDASQTRSKIIAERWDGRSWSKVGSQ